VTTDHSKERITKPSETTLDLVSSAPSCDSQSLSEAQRRRIAAREMLKGIKGDRAWVTGVDDRSLDFLATAISEHMLMELAQVWMVSDLGYPTSSRLAALTEQLYLQNAVAALDC
jgi:hypothetical protein